jgi:hypothetical protein
MPAAVILAGEVRPEPREERRWPVELLGALDSKEGESPLELKEPDMLENQALVRGRLLQIDAGAWRGVPDAELRVLLEKSLIEAFDVITHQVVVDPKRRFDYRLTVAGKLVVWPERR